MRIGTEKIDAPKFALVNEKSTILRQRHGVAAYALVVMFSLVITGGTGAGQAYADAMYRFLRKVKFAVNGGREKQSYDGNFLRAYLTVFSAELLDQVGPANTAAGTKECKGTFYLPQEMLHSVTPEEFGLPTKLVEDPELTITLGNTDDLVTGTDAASIAIEDGEVELYELFYEQDEQVEGAIDQRRFQAQEIKSFDIDITQSGSPKIQLNTLLPGHEVRAVFIQAFQGGAAGIGYTASDTLVTNARLSLNGKTVRDLPWDLAQQLNKRVYALDAAYPGLVVMDAAEDRKTRGPQPIRDARGNVVRQTASELWPIASKERPYLELNVTKQAGECYVRVHVVYVNRQAVPARAVA